MSETATEKPVSETHFSARFSVKHVAALAAIAGGGEFPVIALNGIQVEPNPAGGVILMATNSHMLVWVEDPKGHATSAFVLDVSDKFIDACKEPIVKRPFDANGDEWEIPLPDWMVPHEVIICGQREGMQPSKQVIAPAAKGFDMILVRAKGLPAEFNHITDDGATLFHESGRRHGRTQTVSRKLVDWRSVVPSGDAVPVDVVGLNAQYLGLLANFHPYIQLKFYGPEKGVAVHFAHAPECHALIMPVAVKK